MKKERQIEGSWVDFQIQRDRQIGSMRYVNIEREINIRQKDNPN